MMAVMHSLRGFFVFLFGAVLLRMILKKSGKNRKNSFADFIEKEHEANFSKKQNIPEEIFFNPPFHEIIQVEFPKDDKYTNISLAQKKVLEISKEKMLRLDQSFSNSQIKNQFGISNLEVIIKAEECYNEYIKALCALALEFSKIKRYDESEKILEYCLQLKPDFSMPFTLLGDLYTEKGDIGKLSDFISRIKDMNEIKSNAALYNIIIKHLENID